MIDALKRAFRPIGRERDAAADALNHALRNQTQAAEAERYILAKQNEHWLERALIPPDRDQERGTS